MPGIHNPQSWSMIVRFRSFFSSWSPMTVSPLHRLIHQLPSGDQVLAKAACSFAVSSLRAVILRPAQGRLDRGRRGHRIGPLTSGARPRLVRLILPTVIGFDNALIFAASTSQPAHRAIVVRTRRTRQPRDPRPAPGTYLMRAPSGCACTPRMDNPRRTQYRGCTGAGRLVRGDSTPPAAAFHRLIWTNRVSQVPQHLGMRIVGDFADGAACFRRAFPTESSCFSIVGLTRIHWKNCRFCRRRCSVAAACVLIDAGSDRRTA